MGVEWDSGLNWFRIEQMYDYYRGSKNDGHQNYRNGIGISEICFGCLL